MDNLTHTLFGATLARTRLARAGRGTTATLLVASNAPDVDIVTAARGAISYVRWHRGPTHAAAGVVVLGIVTAAVVFAGYRLFDRWRPDEQREPLASFGMLTAVAIVGVAFHVLMDLPTSYGTRILSPIDWHWYALDWLPIIDIYLLVALAAGLLFGTVAARATGTGRGIGANHRGRMATVALVLMAVNYGLRATAHHEALASAPRLFGPLLPARCEPNAPVTQGALAIWPTERWATPGAAGLPSATDGPAPGVLIDPEPRPPSAAAAAARPCLVEIAAMPTFFSPFRWRLIAHLSNAYELHEIDLLDARLHDDSGAADRMWRLTLRYPDQWTAATARAAATRTAQIFLGFSRFPSARTFTDPTGTATVRWTDMRFAGGLTSLEDRTRRPNPFTLLVRIDPSGRVVDERFAQ